MSDNLAFLTDTLTSYGHDNCGSGSECLEAVSKAIEDAFLFSDSEISATDPKPDPDYDARTAFSHLVRRADDDNADNEDARHDVYEQAGNGG